MIDNAKLPFVSIIVAAYNAEKTIKMCIESLLALDYNEYEIIVVDNNSTDSTLNFIKEYSVTYLLEKKKGWPAARNTGIAYSKSRYIANIDADCFATKDWLKNLVKAFNNENIGCVVGKTLVEEGKTLAQKYYAASDPFNIEDKIGKSNHVPWGGGNNVILRDAFLNAGGYDSERFVSGADVEFHIRLEKRVGYKTIYEPKALIYHEARGSVKEFFSVASKYAHDGFLRSCTKEMKDSRVWYHLPIIGKTFKISQVGYYRIFLVWKFYKIFLLIIGLGHRGIKAVFGKEIWFRVAAAFFSISSESGTVYGYCKGLLKHALRQHES